MSYAFFNPCYLCAKKDTCGDYKKIQEAIHTIHQATDGSHQGSGYIQLSCTKLEKLP